ncbi:MAG: tol-pal system-associated acyl-CoA thioesterase [Maricaulaceae bacterium]|jgi:acyl-CoA thioester hydrolase
MHCAGLAGPTAGGERAVMSEEDGGLPASGRIVAGTHVFPVRVYYEDTDFSGLVYHARHLQFLERGRSEFLRCAGLSHSALLTRDDPLVLAVRRMALDFARAARIDDALEVRSRLVGLKGARFEMEQEIRREGVRLLGAEVEVACLDGTGRPRRVPEDLAVMLRPHLA